MSNIIKAIQEIYPDIKEGYTYWESHFDGSPLEKPEDGLVWENKEYEKPLWADIEDKLKIVELKQVKEEKLTEIKTAKNKALYQPIDYLDTQFISSEKASQNILGALLLNGDNTNTWIDIYDNITVLTKTELQELAVKIKTQKSIVYNNESIKLKEIHNASTIEEVNIIKWDSEPA